MFKFHDSGVIFGMGVGSKLVGSGLGSGAGSVVRVGVTLGSGVGVGIVSGVGLGEGVGAGSEDGLGSSDGSGVELGVDVAEGEGVGIGAGTLFWIPFCSRRVFSSCSVIQVSPTQIFSAAISLAVNFSTIIWTVFINPFSKTIFITSLNFLTIELNRISKSKITPSFRTSILELSGEAGDQ